MKSCLLKGQFDSETNTEKIKKMFMLNYNEKNIIPLT